MKMVPTGSTYEARRRRAGEPEIEIPIPAAIPATKAMSTLEVSDTRRS